MMNLDKNTGNLQQDRLLRLIKHNQVIELSFRAVSKMKMVMDSIDLKIQYNAAKSIRDYKRAIFCLEEHLRDKELNKNYDTLLKSKEKQIPISKMQKSLDYEDRQELVSCYSKIIPEDYDPKDFKVQKVLFSEFSQRSSMSTPVRSHLDIYETLSVQRSSVKIDLNGTSSNSIFNDVISPDKHKSIEKCLEEMSNPRY
jgi:hypothetical protein